MKSAVYFINKNKAKVLNSLRRPNKKLIIWVLRASLYIF